ncbi:MAG TPA: immunoglobulin-like domain-containing protein, partial [Flavisolibacter sp.]|nr:immunoglobulin-like domain-containing protein [Flavisolibacter sp.]
MRYIKIVTPILAIFFLASCEKETTADVSRTVKVTYPTITLKGDQLVVLPVGGTFSDAGATLLDDISGASTSIQATKGSVNTAVPGLYVLTYAASNANGFEASASRLIAVTSVNNPIDRSGTYKRTATGVNAVITKVAN